jgi:tRNA(adenine34) deaminase
MDILRYSDEYFMKEALKEAVIAMKKDEVPVGAVIVCGSRIIARAHNLTEHLTVTTAHAEMQAFTAASDALGSKYLSECTIYVTLEPCVMCAGAAFWTQIGRIVYGARDEKRGYTLISSSIVHPKTQIVYGVMETECSKLLKDYFALKRDPR